MFTNHIKMALLGILFALQTKASFTNENLNNLKKPKNYCQQTFNVGSSSTLMNQIQQETLDDLYFLSPEIESPINSINTNLCKRFVNSFSWMSNALVQGYKVKFDDTHLKAIVTVERRVNPNPPSFQESMQSKFALYELATLLTKNLNPGSRSDISIQATTILPTTTVYLASQQNLDQPLPRMPDDKHESEAETSNADDSEFPAQDYDMTIHNKLKEILMPNFQYIFTLKITTHYNDSQKYLLIEKNVPQANYNWLEFKTLIKLSAIFYAAGFITDEIKHRTTSPLYNPYGDNLADNVTWTVQPNGSVMISPKNSNTEEKDLLFCDISKDFGDIIKNDDEQMREYHSLFSEDEEIVEKK